MPTEPRQVEVVCEGCFGVGRAALTDVEGRRYPASHLPDGRPTCRDCDGSGVRSLPVAPDSLTARMLDFAEAYTARRQADEQGALAMATASEDEIAAIAQLYEAADEALEAAWAALEQHPHYRRPQ